MSVGLGRVVAASRSGYWRIDVGINGLRRVLGAVRRVAEGVLRIACLRLVDGLNEELRSTADPVGIDKLLESRY